MRLSWACAALSASSICPNSAIAQELFSQSGGWEIVKVESGCAMAMEFDVPGNTELHFLKSLNGEIAMSATNENWSANANAEYDISYMFDRRTGFGGQRSLGLTDGARKGFYATFNSDFEAEFMRSDELMILMGKDIIAHLSLSGTGRAMLEVNRCLAKTRAEAAALKREQDRFSYITKDPFAGVAAGGASPHGPIPKGNAAAWASANDYPSRALREQREGVVKYQLEIGADGLILGCSIVASSGHADLDQASCDNAKRRSRFLPATDASGKPITSTFEQSVRWKIPQ